MAVSTKATAESTGAWSTVCHVGIPRNIPDQIEETDAGTAEQMQQWAGVGLLKIPKAGSSSQAL